VAFGGLARPLIFGYDSYYFLNFICGKAYLGYDAGPTSLPPLAQTFFSYFPCNLWAVKLLLFALLALSLYFLIKMDLYNENNALLTGLFVWLSPLLAMEFAKFENDQLAYPLIFASLVLLYSESRLHNAVGTLLAIVAAGFWGGAIFFLAGMMFSSPIAALISAPILAYFAPGMLHWLINIDHTVMENLLFNGIAMQFVLLIGYVGFFFTNFRKKIPKFSQKILFPTIFFTILSIFTGKFAIFLLPFLLLGTVELYKQHLHKLSGLRIMPFMLAVSWAIVVYAHAPQPYHFEAIQYAIQQSPDSYIQNDWDLGHWVVWLGGKTDSWGSPANQKEFGEGMVVTKKELNCKLLKRFGKLKIYNCFKNFIMKD
jgi:hypothetical protein